MPTTDLLHATLWYGTAASVVDLHPNGYLFSEAIGTDGIHQVGIAITDANEGNAMLWHGTAASSVSLHPVGYDWSQANAVKGNEQFGYAGGDATSDYEHAMYWQGSAASAIDLHPAGFRYSEASGGGDGEQVGTGQLSSGHNFNNQALLWTGRANSAINLTPTSFSGAAAYDADGGRQVGYGFTTGASGVEHALLWFGAATNYVDLGALLPSNYQRSYATNIEGDTIFGIGSIGNVDHVVEWTLPEPVSIPILGLVILAGRRYRR